MAMVIGFLRTEGGGCPVEDFLDGLAPKDAQKVLWVFRLIESLERVPTTYLKKLTGSQEIWEVRAQGARQACRALAFRHGDTLWVMNGYSKKSGRTDARGIRRADRMRRDFIVRQGD